jgi:hypothetical protein
MAAIVASPEAPSIAPRQSTSPNAANRKADAFPRVEAATSNPTSTPRSAVAQLAAILMPTRIDPSDRRPYYEAQNDEAH